jgi:hypothetical protein
LRNSCFRFIKKLDSMRPKDSDCLRSPTSWPRFARIGLALTCFRGSKAQLQCGVVGLAVVAVFVGSVSAQDERPAGADLRQELEAVRRRVTELERLLKASDASWAQPRPSEARPSDGTATDDSAAPDDVSATFSPFYERETLGTPRSVRGVYDKPFLASLWRRAHVGGYTEFEFHEFENATRGIPEGFRMHRTNLFLFAEVSDRVRFGSEFEFETEFDGTQNSSDIETKVEMAFVDWRLFEELTLRAGALLVPLGRVNVNHDGPVRDLTDRPLVSTFVIPTTLTEAGAGLHGTFSLPREVSLSYQAYAVNGFDLLDRTGQLATPFTEPEQLLRRGRSSSGGDTNSGVASTGRVALGAVDGFEVGGSWHVGTYDEQGDNFLRIFAGDFGWSTACGGVEFDLEGEVAVANFQRDSFARTAGVPDRFWGYYVQGGVGGMPAGLRRFSPVVFAGSGARLKAVLRYEWVDLDGDRGAAIEPGVAFLPVADTVFKLSFRFTQKQVGLDVPGRSLDDDGAIFSVSSYF